ncbi:hypothetical protein ABK040_010458 [Willaertia magna]
MSDYEDDFESDFEDDFEEDFVAPNNNNIKDQPVIVNKNVTVSKPTTTTLNSRTSTPSLVNNAVREAMLLMNMENEAILEKKGKQELEDKLKQENQEIIFQQKAIKVKPTMSKEEKEKYDKMKKRYDRATMISDLISMDLVGSELFDLPPLSDFELYQRSFIKSGSMTATVQCPSVNERKDSSVNTINSLQISRSVQAPEDLGISNKSNPRNSMDRFKFNSMALGRFLKAVGPVCDRILESNELVVGGKKIETTTNNSTFKFSASSSTFLHPVTSKREVKEILFTNNNRLIVCYGSCQGGYIDDKGVICIWDPLSPKYPIGILVCDCSLTSVCCLPDRPNIVVAGSSDGSLIVWDANQFPTQRQVGKETISVIYPSYCTASFFNETHLMPVKRVLAVGYNLSIFAKQSRTVDNYIISMDEGGNIIYWLVAFLSQQAISETEYGLSIGGKVKLVNSGKLNVFGEPFPELNLKPDIDDEKFGSLIFRTTEKKENDIHEQEVLPSISAASFIDIDPSNTSQLLIGTDFGKILRRGRFEHNIKPYNICKRKNSYPAIFDISPIKATCIDFNIFLPHFFLVGFEDGSFNLYINDYEDPIINFKHYTSSPILDIKWSASDPSLFFVLTISDDLLILKLSNQNPDKLIFREKLTLKEGEISSRVTSNLGLPALSQKQKAFDILVKGSKDTKIQPNNNIAIGYANGNVDLHWTQLPFPNTDLEYYLKELEKEIKSYIC